MSKARKLLSINEENTIFITARFVCSAYQVGTDLIDVDNYFDLELIVNNDITCNQLMDAIRIGLEEKFVDLDDYQSKEFEDYIYDHYNPINNCGDPDSFKDFKDMNEQDIYGCCLSIYLDCYKDFYKKVKKYDSFIQYKHSVSRSFINFKEESEENNNFYLYEAEHGEMTLEELGFVSASRINFDWPSAQRVESLFEENDAIVNAFKNRKPQYNISDTPLYKLDVEPIKIISPTEPPKKSRVNLVMSILSPILMTIMMFIARTFSNKEASFNYLPMMIATIITTILISISNYLFSRKDFEKSLNEWQTQYQDYIVKVINDIIKKQKWDIEQLNLMYPAVLPNLEHISMYKEQDLENETCLINMIREINGEIYSRNQEHPDFLSVRLGISSNKSQLVESLFKVEGERKDAIFSSARYNQIGDISHPFRISIPKGDSELPYLIDLPADIASTYAHLHGAPVLLNIKECGTLGLVFHESISFQPFLENIILNLCFYHSPEDVQFVYFAENYNDYCKENANSNISKWQYEQKKIERFKHLPHFRELLTDLDESKDISSFAFDNDSALKILNKLLEILSNRSNQEKRKNPQIIMIFENEYDFKRHPVSEYLSEYKENEKREDYGINFIFCKRHLELLPKYCGQVIKVTKEKKAKEDKYRWFLLPHSQLILRNDENKAHNINIDNYEFISDSFAKNNLDFKIIYQNFNRSFKILSALYYDRIEQAGDVPTSVKLFELVNTLINEEDSKLIANSIDDLLELRQKVQSYIENEWGAKFQGTRDVTKSLAVPIGCRSNLDSENSLVSLDLHETADGPHMLVAGTTGSGKTETILTYLIMLCMYYTPRQINLLLMDMKGAGFVKRIGKLPHVVGKVTDVDGDENGTSMEYMLNRFLKSMSSEVKRRKLMLSKMGVDAIDGYIKAKNNIDTHILEVLKLNPESAKDEQERIEIENTIKEIKELDDMPHLFLVIDEFTELMRFSSDNSDIDFKSEITSLARIGRSLGFHIILISQNIEGAITPDIRVNSKARLCLKVATREASKEMIGRDLAASPLMPGNGRAYLLIGTGSRFEYFQSAYSGAYSVENNDKRILVTEVNKCGENSLFFDSNDVHEDKLIYIEEKENNISQGDVTLSERIDVNLDQKKVFSDSSTQSTETQEKYDSSDKSQISIISETLKSIKIDDKVHTVFQSPLPRMCYFDYNTKSVKKIKRNVEV